MKKNHASWDFIAAFCLPLTLFGACSKKMEEKECDRLRAEAFEIVNKAHYCGSDADCRQSEWPGCQKPVSNASFDKIKPLRETFTKGQCEESKSDCKQAPPVYCKQGLCVHREAGRTEAPGEGMKVE